LTRSTLVNDLLPSLEANSSIVISIKSGKLVSGGTPAISQVKESPRKIDLPELACTQPVENRLRNNRVNSKHMPRIPAIAIVLGNLKQIQWSKGALSGLRKRDGRGQLMLSFVVPYFKAYIESILSAMTDYIV
jgi:hypothetical protein